MTRGAPESIIWDLPLRLCHWLFLVLIVLCWWTAEQQQMDNHKLAAYCLLSTLIFRIYWGFVGSSSARFSEFVKTPRAVVAYTKQLRAGISPDRGGHNPLGALSVLLLLALMLTQISLGLFAIDTDGFEGGPFADYIDFDLARSIAEIHEITFYALVCAIGLHLIAIAYYLISLKKNLVSPMLSGKHNGKAETVFPEYYGVRIGVGLSLSASLFVSLNQLG